MTTEENKNRELEDGTPCPNCGKPFTKADIVGTGVSTTFFCDSVMGGCGKAFKNNYLYLVR